MIFGYNGFEFKLLNLRIYFQNLNQMKNSKEQVQLGTGPRLNSNNSNSEPNIFYWSNKSQNKF